MGYGERTTSVDGQVRGLVYTWHQLILINKWSHQASQPWAGKFEGRGNDCTVGRQLNRSSSLKRAWWAGKRKQTIPHSSGKNLSAESDEICKEENPSPPGTPKRAVHLNPTVLSYPSRRADSRPHSFSNTHWASITPLSAGQCSAECQAQIGPHLSAADPGQDRHGPLSLCVVFKFSCRKSFPM